jgi:hypothetical protein
MLLRATDPFARRPGDQDYQQARERFAEKLDEYVQALRAWLAEYREAEEARVRTFELRLRVISAKSGAYAEDVVLTSTCRRASRSSTSGRRCRRRPRRPPTSRRGHGQHSRSRVHPMPGSI